jgi:hypothetical protein
MNAVGCRCVVGDVVVSTAVPHRSPTFVGDEAVLECRDETAVDTDEVVGIEVE